MLAAALHRFADALSKGIAHQDPPLQTRAERLDAGGQVDRASAEIRLAEYLQLPTTNSRSRQASSSKDRTARLRRLAMVVVQQAQPAL
jgi:hypothetical protein